MMIKKGIFIRAISLAVVLAFSVTSTCYGYTLDNLSTKEYIYSALRPVASKNNAMPNDYSGNGGESHHAAANAEAPNPKRTDNNTPFLLKKGRQALVFLRRIAGVVILVLSMPVLIVYNMLVGIFNIITKVLKPTWSKKIGLYSLHIFWVLTSAIMLSGRLDLLKLLKIAKVKKSSHVLDLYCGLFFPIIMSCKTGRDGEYVGLDNKPLITLLNKFYAWLFRLKPNINFVTADASDLTQFKDENFDFVFLSNPHAWNTEEIKRVLKPGGKVIFSRTSFSAIKEMHQHFKSAGFRVSQIKRFSTPNIFPFAPIIILMLSGRFVQVMLGVFSSLELIMMLSAVCLVCFMLGYLIGLTRYFIAEKIDSNNAAQGRNAQEPDPVQEKSSQSQGTKEPVAFSRGTTMRLKKASLIFLMALSSQLPVFMGESDAKEVPLTDFLNERIEIDIDKLIKIPQTLPKPVEYPEYIKYYEKGADSFKAGKFKEALEHINKAITLNPFFAEGYNLRGLAQHGLAQEMLTQGKEEDARKNYQNAFNDYKKAVDLYTEAINKLDKRTPELDMLAGGYIRAFFNLGTLLGETDKPRSAIVCFQRILTLNPKHSAAWYNKGIEEFRLKRLKEAEDSFTNAIKSSKDFAPAYGMRGLVNTLLGKNDKAMEDYDEAIRLDPKLTDAHVNRGMLNFVLGQKLNAKEEFEVAKKHLKAAEKDFKKAIELGVDKKTEEDIGKNLGIIKETLEGHDKLDKKESISILKSFKHKFESTHGLGLSTTLIILAIPVLGLLLPILIKASPISAVILGMLVAGVMKKTAGKGGTESKEIEVRKLLKELEHQEAVIRIRAAKKLAKITNTDIEIARKIMPELKKLLYGEDFYEASSAALVLQRLRYKKATDILIEAFNFYSDEFDEEYNERIRSMVGRALSKKKRPGKRVYILLVDRLKTRVDDKKGIRRITQYVANLGKPAVEFLLELIREEDDVWIRGRVEAILKDMVVHRGQKDVLAELMKYSQDENDNVRKTIEHVQIEAEESPKPRRDVRLLILPFVFIFTLFSASLLPKIALGVSKLNKLGDSIIGISESKLSALSTPIKGSMGSGLDAFGTSIGIVPAILLVIAAVAVPAILALVVKRLLHKLTKREEPSIRTFMINVTSFGALRRFSGYNGAQAKTLFDESMIKDKAEAARLEEEERLGLFGLKIEKITDIDPSKIRIKEGDLIELMKKQLPGIFDSKRDEIIGYDWDVCQPVFSDKKSSRIVGIRGRIHVKVKMVLHTKERRRRFSKNDGFIERKSRLHVLLILFGIFGMISSIIELIDGKITRGVIQAALSLFVIFFLQPIAKSIENWDKNRIIRKTKKKARVEKVKKSVLDIASDAVATVDRLIESARFSVKSEASKLDKAIERAKSHIAKLEPSRQKDRLEARLNRIIKGYLEYKDTIKKINKAKELPILDEPLSRLASRLRLKRADREHLKNLITNREGDIQRRIEKKQETEKRSRRLRASYRRVFRRYEFNISLHIKALMNAYSDSRRIIMDSFLLLLDTSAKYAEAAIEFFFNIIGQIRKYSKARAKIWVIEEIRPKLEEEARRREEERRKERARKAEEEKEKQRKIAWESFMEGLEYIITQLAQQLITEEKEVIEIPEKPAILAIPLKTTETKPIKTSRELREEFVYLSGNYPRVIELISETVELDLQEATLRWAENYAKTECDPIKDTIAEAKGPSDFLACKEKIKELQEKPIDIPGFAVLEAVKISFLASLSETLLFAEADYRQKRLTLLLNVDFAELKKILEGVQILDYLYKKAKYINKLITKINEHLMDDYVPLALRAYITYELEKVFHDTYETLIRNTKAKIIGRMMDELSKAYKGTIRGEVQRGALDDVAFEIAKNMVHREGAWKSKRKVSWADFLKEISELAQSISTLQELRQRLIELYISPPEEKKIGKKPGVPEEPEQPLRRPERFTQTVGEELEKWLRSQKKGKGDKKQSPLPSAKPVRKRIDFSVIEAAA